MNGSTSLQSASESTLMRDMLSRIAGHAPRDGETRCESFWWLVWDRLARLMPVASSLVVTQDTLGPCGCPARDLSVQGRSGRRRPGPPR